MTVVKLVYKLITRRVIPLQCARCTYRWEYAGKNEYFATCPHCKTCVNVRKQLKTPLVDESGIETPNSTTKVVLSNENLTERDDPNG